MEWRLGCRSPSCDAPASRTQRLSNGNLVDAHAGFARQQPGDVRAGDEQQRQRGSKQEIKSGERAGAS
jgi:hypothetical protein